MPLYILIKVKTVNNVHNNPIKNSRKGTLCVSRLQTDF